MASTLSVTLVADGTSDHRMLVPLIRLLLDELSSVAFRIASASNEGDGHHLDARIARAVHYYPCDLLLVHRDAEGQDAVKREAEISMALQRGRLVVPHVCIVPVRMTEAWLLVDEMAVRYAVGNPRGTAELALPSHRQIERCDAKQELFRALGVAQDLGARRMKAFNPLHHRHHVAERMDNLDLLRRLPSFQHFEQGLQACLARIGLTG